MKILQVCQTHPPEFSGGSTLYAIRLATELARRGFIIEVLCASRNPSIRPYELTYEKTDIYNIVRMGFPRGRTYGRRHTHKIKSIFKRYLLDNNVELVNFHSAVGIGEGIILAAKEIGIPSIVTLHDGWWICPTMSFLRGANNDICNSPNLIKCFMCRFEREITVEPIKRWPRSMARILLSNYWIIYYRQEYLKAVNKIISTCDFLKNKHLEYGIESNYAVIKTRIDEKEISFKQIRNHRHPVRFLSLSAFRPNKGGELLIGALRLIRNGNRYFEFHVWGPSDPQVMKRIGNKMDKLPIFIHGPYQKNDLNKILSETDVLVLSSCGEGYPLVLLEALASRTPVIAAKSHGMVEIVQEGKNGLFFKPFDENSLSAAIAYFIENPDMISIMQNHISPPMPYAAMVDNIINTYLEVINNKQI